ncbi:hypothetical protein RRG08_014268 [Elysia crispata]|uniref:Uncharacterized protein n=1 Tax=Elysia crispata TaxID=231223 RepID=A0AAE1DL50_9GAST|nr:hypothetical protein RRG08_014268 [Elysia crispata]
MRNVAFTPKGDHIAWTRVEQFTNSINTICVHKPRLCFQLSSVIVSLRPSVVFGYRGILLIFLAYETQGVLYVISAPIWPIFSNQENMTFDLVSLAIVLCSFLSMGLIIILEEKIVIKI